MLAHYGVDVLDPRVSLRRIAVLTRRLPPGAWPDPDTPMSWSTESHLLASVIDSLAALIFVTLRANGAKSAKQPKPWPRPGGGNKRRPAQQPGTAVKADGARDGSWTALAKALVGGKGVRRVG